MRIADSTDKFYPYIIAGGWGDKVYADFEDLLDLERQIKKIKDKQKKKMTRNEIIEGIIETMENCPSDCSCFECPIKEFCDAWGKTA